jgi:hypothetical protein
MVAESERKEQELEHQRKLALEDLEKREALRLEAKAKELRRRRIESQKLFEKQRERMNSSKQRELAADEEKLTKFQEGERLMQQRIAACQRKRDETITHLRRRNDEKVNRSKSVILKIEQDDLVRRQEIEKRNVQTVERLEQLIVERRRKSELAKKEGKSRAEERRTRRQEMEDERLDGDKQKVAGTQTRLEEVRRCAEGDARDRAADAWLRMRINEDNARRLERRAEWERELTLKKMEEKAEAVERMNQTKQADAAARKKRSEAVAAKRKKLISEFARAVDVGDDIDLEQLAKQFGLDYQGLVTRALAGGKIPRIVKAEDQREDDK